MAQSKSVYRSVRPDRRKSITRIPPASIAMDMAVETAIGAVALE